MSFKWRFDREGTWVYPAIRVTASEGDVIEADYQIDQYWVEVDPSTPATIASPAPDLPSYYEVPDGAFLRYDDEANRFVPSLVSTLDEFGRVTEEGLPERLSAENLDARYAESTVPPRIGEHAQRFAAPFSWDTVVENGLYAGSADDGPFPGLNCMVRVESWDSEFVTQTLWRFTGATPEDSMCYRRYKQANVWQPWHRVTASQAELDARYLREGIKVSDAELADRIASHGDTIVDWNQAIDSGFYNAFEAANAPEPGGITFVGIVAKRNDNYTLQHLYKIHPDLGGHYIRSLTGGIWSAWVQIPSQAEADERYAIKTGDIWLGSEKVVDNGELPHELRRKAMNIATLAGGDWNNVIHSGWYMGSSATNAPNDDPSWFYGFVVSHNDSYVTQFIQQMTGAGRGVWYHRQKFAGTWESWSVFGSGGASGEVTQAELDAVDNDLQDFKTRVPMNEDLMFSFTERRDNRWTAANGNWDAPVFVAPHDTIIHGCDMVFSNDVAGDNSNYWNVFLQQYRNGSKLRDIALRTTQASGTYANGAIVGWAPWTFDGANWITHTLAAGDSVRLRIEPVGAAPDFPFQWNATFRYQRA